MKRLLLLALFIPTIAFAYPKPVGLVNDFADILSPQEEAALEEKIKGPEVAIVTIESLEGNTIENYANELFQEWGIGSAEKDDGILILVSEQDREVRIEVGYGLEGEITDAESFWIIEDKIKPNFKQGRYFEGLNEALDEIVRAEKEEIQQSISWQEIVIYMIIILIFFGFRVFIWRVGGRSSGGFGGSSGGFGGFGGGSSGGGGASGDW